MTTLFIKFLTCPCKSVVPSICFLRKKRYYSIREVPQHLRLRKLLTSIIIIIDFIHSLTHRPIMDLPNPKSHVMFGEGTTNYFMR